MNNYESYRDAQSFWMDKAPSHWKSLKNKHVFTQKKEIVGENWELFTLLTMGKGGVKPRDMDAGGKFPESFETYQVVNPDQLIFCLFDLDETPRTVGLSKDHGMITSAYDVFSTREGNDPQYWTYFYQNVDDHKGLRPYYTGLRKVVRYDTFMGIDVYSPPLEEQNRISSYLDKKTIQIDLLINKIEKKIELLKEQRTSLINQYVTKGLDPNVEMKDSGIELIGEIPKHWNILKIKHVVKDGGFRSGPFGSALITNQLSDSGDWIVYSPENLRSDNVSDQLYVPDDRKKELEKYLVSVNDIVLPIVGSLNVSKVITEKDKPGIINQRLCRISLDPHKANINYISFLFKFSNLIQNQIEIEKKGSILDHITKEIIFNFIFPSPTDQKERDQLYEKVHSTNENFKVLIDKNELKIKILREYRQSLISSVVTGKLRVTEEMV